MKVLGHQHRLHMYLTMYHIIQWVKHALWITKPMLPGKTYVTYNSVYYRPRYPSRSILCLCPIFIISHYLPPFEFPTLSQKLAIASLSNFLGILRTSVRRSDRNCRGI